MPAVDDIDRQIVALLREDARRSFQSIGARVALSAPAVKRRVDRLEADGVIRGYAALLDPGAMGWPTHALVALYCEGRMAASEVRDAVAPHPEVSAAFTVAGEASAILHVHARDTAHLEQTLERIRDTPGITRTQTQVVLSTLLERPVGRVGGVRRQATSGTKRTRRAPRRGQEREQPLALGRDRLGAVRRVAGVRDEAVDRQRRLVAVLGDLPVRPVEAVDEQRPDRPAAARQRRARAEAGEQARAVGVGQADVVVLGEEARRRGRLGSGSAAVLDVEQFAAPLVAEACAGRGAGASTTARRPVSPDQVRMSATVAGPKAAR